MNATNDIVHAITALAWPFIVGLLLWRLFPSIKKIVESRGFTVRVGQAELTVQEVSEKVLAATADIQGKLAEVTAPTLDRSAELTGTASHRPLRRVLWVDDVPLNNTYEVAQLQTLGVEVVQETSTDSAVVELAKARAPFNAVITDLGRREEYGFNVNAGIELIERLRQQGNDMPIFVYSSPSSTRRRDEIVAAGGNGVTASPTELFALLRAVGPFPE